MRQTFQAIKVIQTQGKVTIVRLTRFKNCLDVLTPLRLSFWLRLICNWLSRHDLGNGEKGNA